MAVSKPIILQNDIKQYKVNSLYPILIKIENTIRDLAKLYATEITANKKKQFEIWIKEVDIMSMAILTILRNRK